VRSRARGTRRVIALGLLLPGFLFLHPQASPAEPKATKPAQKRVASKPARKQPVTAATPPSRSDGCVHVVRRGDSVGRLALRYRVTRQSIIARNRLKDSNVLRVGQRLEIPACRSGAPAGRGPLPQAAAALHDGTELFARVGPRRIPTRLFVAVPEAADEGLELRWPVEGPVVSGFGRRPGGWHAGIDIKADVGTPIHAASPGVVVFSGSEPSYGRMVTIRHSDGFVTIYAHNFQNLVKTGDEVSTDTVIATVGRSGHASACHLHFEVRRDGVAYNPLYLLEGHARRILASAPDEALDDLERRE
jgi:lipoprotein NlpD